MKLLAFALLVLWVCVPVAGVKGGIKRRLQEHQEREREHEDEHAANTEAARSSTDRIVRTRAGGVRQRLAASSASSSTTAEKYPMFESLRKDWARGKVASAKVLEYISGAIAQGAEGMSNLQNVGDHNAYRTLLSAFGMPTGAPEITWLDIPTVRSARTPHPFIMPHNFVASYFQTRQSDFASTLSGPEGACAQFWHCVKDLAFVREHPKLGDMDLSKVIPLGIHGDAGAFSKVDSIYVISWNSLVGRGTTAAKRFVFTVLRKTDMVEGTLDRVFRIMAWSFNAMLDGLMPARTIDGVRLHNGGGVLAGGWSGAACQVRGDWAFYTEVFGFPPWNGAQRMCWLCQASSTIPELAWTQMGPDAGWRRARWTHTTYLEHLRTAGLVIPALLTAVVGLRLECILVDALHTVDQGVASHIIANVFWLFAVVRGVFGASTQDKKVEKLNGHLQSWYKQTKCKSKLQGALTVARLRTSGNWPKLKGKAAATRHLAAYALHLVETYGTAADNLVLAVCQLLCEFYDILNSESMFLGAQARIRLPDVGKQLAVLYTRLATTAAASRIRMWKVSPKLHIFVHLCEWQALDWGNPRYYWTYADEDLVGLLSEVGASCHVSTLASSAFMKWLHVYYE